MQFKNKKTYNYMNPFCFRSVQIVIETIGYLVYLLGTQGDRCSFVASK